MTHIAADTAVAKPLKTYIPLIAEQFELAEKAGIDYYRAAGTLLVEVRATHFQQDTKGFFAWAEKNFKKKPDQIRIYTALAAADEAKFYKNLEDFRRTGLGRHSSTRSSGRIHREWTAPVDAIADRARAEQRRLLDDEFHTRAQERNAEAQLGLRLISIGYKVLAQELHPDKGGSREAMTRLNRVRDRLKTNV